MHRALIAVIALLQATPAFAQTVVVWLEPELPADRDQRRAEAVLDGEAYLHYGHEELAFPPEPWTSADERAYEGLRAEIVEGRARWDQFDVELDIARQLDVALAGVDIVRDRRDLEHVIGALLLQGSAVSRAWPPMGFQDAPEAEVFRAPVPGARVNRPWLDAIGLQPDRTFVKGDVADGGPWPEFQEILTRLQGLPPGYLDLSDFPRDGKVYIDGDDVEMGLRQVELRPGTHFVHLVRDGVVIGRQKIAVEAGITTRAPLEVDGSELGSARATLIGGSTVGFPVDVTHALDAIGKFHSSSSLYVAALDEGRVVVQPYAGDAKRVRKRPVTVVLSGEIGGGAIISPLFDPVDGDTTTAAAAHGGLGLEIGIYYGAILGGFDIALTPGQTITHGNRDETANVTSSVLPQAWGGVGAYLLRPNESHATLLLAATYGWYGPAHLGPGGRIALGIPIDDRGTWFRIAVGGSSSAKSAWDTGADKTPMHVLFLRFGFAARF